MQIFNTLTRQKEEFVPQVPGEYRIYVCGPTVYNYIHIGNARPLIVFDTLRRYLEYRGNKVIYVSNITDIDDKLIKKGQEEGTSMKEVAQRFEAEYLKDAAGLNCKKPTVQPRATEHIQQILDIVKDLIDSGHAYVAKNGDVYFRVKSDPEYGKLSHLKLDDLESGNRELRSQMEDDLKEDPADFAVWKAAKPGEPAWESPYGMGRPGWHIECSAMARKHLGETIDIHAGGEDLIFPHHENEIAQSECANGCEFAHYWMHNAFLNINNKKMSKSLGNCIYLSEEPDEIKKKVMSMYTDPDHIKITDPGKIEGNTVFTYLDAFCQPEHFERYLPDYANLDELKAHYQRGGLGDVKVKKFLNNVLQETLEPIRNRRKELEKDIPAIYEMLKKGSEEAEKVAAQTLADVKAAMKINYFDDLDLIRSQAERYGK